MAVSVQRGLVALVLIAYGIDALVVTRGTPAEAKKPAGKNPFVSKSAQVLALHKQLDAISTKLGAMFTADGAMAHAKVGPTMQVFLKELQGVLKETGAGSKLAPAVALQKLQAAKQGLAGLMSDLNNRQESLMKEDNTQRESLLLGVLMTRQKDPMDKQLKILANDDFSGLEVAKALMAKHNATLPLYVQAASYLDAHPKRKLAPMPAHSSSPLANVQSMLEKRLNALQHEYDVRKKLHERKVADFATELKTVKGKEQHTVHMIQKREERNWKKFSALRTHDIKAMKDAVDGVKKGDMKAVQRARTALETSLKAMQSQTGGFLYLIQLGNTLTKRDCPYCAAQCVDKCHNDGKPYTQCLTDCADAGK
jgi:hypothetical protein